MKESQLQSAVIQAARTLGWRVAHFRTSMSMSGRYATAVQGDGAGFPDLVMVKGGRLAFVELKQDGKYPSPQQREWLDALREINLHFDAPGDHIEVYVWKPKDWTNGTIEKILKG